MAEHQRKIELQSSSDLTYLLDNIRAAAQQKINRDFPPSAAQADNDEFRSKVGELVEQYICETMSLALPSLSVNGLDATNLMLTSIPDEEANESSYEPYDTRLAQRLRDLYSNLEDETTKVANLRREAPRKAAATYLDLLKQDMAANDASFESQRESIKSQPLPEFKAPKFASGENMQHLWSQSRKDLEQLRNVTKVKADLERAIRAAGEVEKR